MPSYTATFKICIFGDGGVGKTSLTRRYVTNRFEEDTKLTIGVDILTKDVEIENFIVKLQIWDFGGEERFRFFLPIYARGSTGGIFMYDLTRLNSLNNLDEWLSVFKEKLTEEERKIPILLVGGKKDLQEKKTIPIEYAMKLAQSHGINDIIECSAKTGENVENIFKTIVYKIIKNIKLI